MMQKKELSFEEAIAELQSVVERMEAGRVPLAESLALYERGMALVSLCNTELDRAEQRISAVKVGPDGIGTEPFTPEAGV